MQTLHLDQIVVPDYRMRREFDESRIVELADDIAANGLMHPIVVRQEGEVFFLIAGERRLRAIKHLFANGFTELKVGGRHCSLPELAVSNFEEVSHQQALEMELSENTIRLDLSWQERVEAIAQLDALRNAISTQTGDSYTPTDLAKEIGGDTANAALAQSVRDAVVIAKHLDDPEVRAAKTQREAVRILEKKHKDILREELAARVASVPKTVDGQVLAGSAFDILPTLPSGKFDLIITDPPYGIDADKMNAQGGSQSGVEHNYQDDLSYASQCTELLAREGFRVTKNNAALYMFCDIKFWPGWVIYFREAGWYVWPVPLIWNKGNVGSLLGAANGPRHCYEAILYATKGSRACKTLSDIVSVPSPRAELHAAEKPVELYVDLLARLAVPGDEILDPFCGSGPVFPAARSLHCTATGIEMNNAHVSTATLRLFGAQE